MSVSQHDANVIDAYATAEWNTFTREEKIRRASSMLSEADADRVFAAKNAADKHQMTLASRGVA